jgi:integrase
MVFMPPKTKAGRRTIKLGEGTLHVLRKQKARQQLDRAVAGKRWQEMGLIFTSKVGTPLSSPNVLQEFKALLEVAGLRKIRFHGLRHTAASLMLNHGIPALVVSKILGHSKPSTTLDIYGHLIPFMQDGVANLMDELVTPVPVEMGESVDLPVLSKGS